MFLASFEDSANNDSWVETCQHHYRKVMASNPSILSGKRKYINGKNNDKVFDFMIPDIASSTSN